jgi:16S rRNA (cytosine967-C5)-methyltransferase
MQIETDEAYSHIALDHALRGSSLDGRDKGLATALVYGVLTWQRALDNILTRHLRKGGTRRLDTPVRTVLRLGAYQLRFLDRVPDHAAVDASVELCKEVGKPRAAGLVNAVLRAVAEDEEPWWREADRDRKRARWLGDKWSLPTWVANRFQQHFGDEAEAVAEAFNTSPPLYLRKPKGADDLEGVEPIEGVPSAFRSADAEVWRDEVIQGNWVVQDLGSQLVGHFAGASAGIDALDACAGLGGKAFQLAEAGASVTAIDPNASKLKLLRSGAESLGFDIAIQQTTLEDFAESTDRTFALVLVDAPCSGLGVMRRHAETRWRREESDIPRLSRIQRKLLDAAAGLVEPGGVLTYSVCTFTREETNRQIERFLADHPEFERVSPPEGPIDWTSFTTSDGDLRTMPHTHNADGFYAARLQRALKS